MDDKERKRRTLRKRYIFLILIVLLIIGRILLPYFLKNYVNKTLNDIPGYTGYVESIDVALWRGAYVINGLILKKEDAQTQTPMLDFRKSDISIEWKALLKGKIVSEVILHGPKFHYILEDQKSSESEADKDDWTKVLKDLVPIDINHLNVHNGSAGFVELSSEPQIDLFLEKINLDATNLSNVENPDETLPSHLHVKAVSFGGGDVTISGNLNLLKEIPDMDIEFSLEKADVTALNDLSERFAGVDFSSGTFELYSEWAIADAYLKGYIQPMFINVRLLGEEDRGFFENLWEGFVGTLKFLFKNQKTDTLATKAPLEGNLQDVESSTWTTILNIFKNAWIQAFSDDVDESIDFEDARIEEK